VLDDLSLETLKITPEDLTNMDIGVFVSNARKDNEVFNRIQTLAEYALNSQTAKLSDIIAMYKSSSATEMEQILKKAEKKQERLIQQQQQAAQELAEAEKQAEIEMMDREYQHKKEIEQMKIEAGIQEKQIDVFKFQQDLDMDNNNVPDPLEIDK
jgi:cell division septum initiation protein DivIVA